MMVWAGLFQISLHPIANSTIYPRLFQSLYPFIPYIPYPDIPYPNIPSPSESSIPPADRKDREKMTLGKKNEQKAGTVISSLQIEEKRGGRRGDKGKSKPGTYQKTTADYFTPNTSQNQHPLYWSTLRVASSPTISTIWVLQIQRTDQ